MGTSRKSSTMKSVMQSLIIQLNEIYEKKEVISNEIEDVRSLKDKLQKSLEAITAKNKNEKIILLLDSIDQLSEQDKDNLDWMFYNLPENVKIIYSALSNYSNIHKLKKKIGEENCLIITKLEKEEARIILEGFLKKENRQLTKEQWEAMDKVLSNTREIYPLHVKLLFDISSKWRSSFKVADEFEHCTTTIETIKYLFKNMERIFGEVLFTHCIFYLTLFDYKGISESEFEDIMSIDDDVLHEVFKYHHPPVRRFPIALWLNIKYELNEYITNKETDEVPVVAWFHRAFIEASHEYLESKPYFKKSKDSILMNVFDYFNEKWNETKSSGEKGEKKEFEYSKTKLHKFEVKPNEKSSQYLAYRNTRPQKIKSESNIFNKRKLNELVNVIMMLENREEKIKLLKEFVYFNCEFMTAKAELHQIDFVIETHKKIEDLNDEELTDVSLIYVNQFPAIDQNPNNLIWIVSSRLAHKTTFMKQLIQPSRLLIAHKMIEDVKHIFHVDAYSRIIDLFSITNAPLLFILLYSSLEGNLKLCLINSNTKQHLGELNITDASSKIIKMVVKDNRNIKKLDDLSGFVYFIVANELRSINYNNEISSVAKFDKTIFSIFLLNENNLIVFLQKELIRINRLNSNTRETFIEDENIVEIKSILVDSEVYTYEDLRKLEKIPVIIALENKVIKIYLFDSNDEILSLYCKIDDIKWSLYGIVFITQYIEGETHRETLIIDKTFLIDKNNLNSSKNEAIIRFAVEENGVVKVVEVNDKKNYSIVSQIDEMSLNINREEFNDILADEKLELIGLARNKLILSLRVNTTAWPAKNIYVFDTGINYKFLSF